MPVIEEIDDDEIDSKHFSLEEFDPHNPFSKEMPVEEGAPVQLRPTAPSPSAAPSSSNQAPRSFQPSSRSEEMLGEDGTVPVSTSRSFRSEHGQDLPEHMKEWSIIYPVYFDKTRSLRQGRRVPYEQAVLNPLAVMINDACMMLGLEAALEVTKQHPKDWANPGRVRVNISEGRSKREIFKKISDFLKSNPVTRQTAREDQYRRLAQFDSLQPLATPRGMRFPKILPGISPVLSARKLIDDAMKSDMSGMAGMGGGMPGMPGMGM